ncbi:hypothetical protein F53441_14606 [Fusarium austroafricanum]|uniref:Uncharacterized protein n=1 Tax=Fusarium austroafricanum TaxID=2364996 RepID=A0A8H4JAL8_9HYPO|nr:hypothetical protein F53441_14606 [Fusarium austroafricanum]
MKRSRESSDDEEDLHTQKKGRIGISMPSVISSADFAATMTIPFNKKRNMEEMSGQVEPESNRPAKRMGNSQDVTWDGNVDDDMQDESMTHSSRSNKRKMEQMSGQVEPDSDRPAKRMGNSQDVTWDRNVDDVMQDEFVTHSPHRNKRNVEQMSGQADSGRSAKRLAHHHFGLSADRDGDVMQDENVMYRSRNNKRNMGEMSGQVEPQSNRQAKRLNHGHSVTRDRNVDEDMQDEPMTYSPRSNKRNMEEMVGQVEPDSDRPAKRMDRGYGAISAASDDHTMRDEADSTQRLEETIPDYEERVKLYHLLLQPHFYKELSNTLNRAFKSDSATLAKLIHDSPPHIRLWAFGELEKLGPEYRRTIIDRISEIERDKRNNDPFSALPNVMTDSLIRNRSSDTRTCVVCGGGFCSENKKNLVDVEDVVWKDCGFHLMHLECFRTKVFEGEMPLKGLCACIKNFC